MELIPCDKVSYEYLKYCILRKLWNYQNVLILTLAGADLMMSLGGVAYPAISAYHRHWVFDQLTCEIYAFATNFVGELIPIRPIHPIRLYIVENRGNEGMYSTHLFIRTLSLFLHLARIVIARPSFMGAYFSHFSNRKTESAPKGRFSSHTTPTPGYLSCK